MKHLDAVFFGFGLSNVPCAHPSLVLVTRRRGPPRRPFSRAQNYSQFQLQNESRRYVGLALGQPAISQTGTEKAATEWIAVG